MPLGAGANAVRNSPRIVEDALKTLECAALIMKQIEEANLIIKEFMQHAFTATISDFQIQRAERWLKRQKRLGKEG
jgi:hypothetical protein